MMKVKELIEVLKGLDPEMEVGVGDWTDEAIGPFIEIHAGDVQVKDCGEHGSAVVIA